MRTSSYRLTSHEPRRRKMDRSEGEFLWLISLSDLMMLLFVFFVVLYSFASKKLSADDYVKIKNVFHGKLALKNPNTPMDEMQAGLLKWVTDRKLLDSVDVTRKEDALILEIKEKLLFPAGDSDLKPEAAQIIPTLREALLKIPEPYRIGIEGHTDDTPVSGGSNNWHLSVERALNVEQALKLPPEIESRLVIMGFGDTHPLAPNRDEKGQPIAANQALNRRVTIRVF